MNIKLFIGAAFAIIYNYTAELFPTPVRSIAVGTCSMISRVGGFCSPLFLALHEQVSWLPGFIFGSTALLAGCIVMVLPETLNEPMMMNFEDAANLYRKKTLK